MSKIGNIHDFLRDMLRVQLHFECTLWNVVYTRVQGPNYCGGHESILNLISIFLLHFDIRLFDFVVLAYPTKRRLTIGNSRIDLPSIQRDLLFGIPSQNFKRI